MTYEKDVIYMLMLIEGNIPILINYNGHKYIFVYILCVYLMYLID